jgi:hypothetical protein
MMKRPSLVAKNEAAEPVIGIGDLEGALTSVDGVASPKTKSADAEVEVELPLENIQAAKNVWLYFIFILFYTYSTISGRNYNDESSYDFVNG